MTIAAASARRRTGFISLLRAAAFAPFWAAQIVTGAKSFADNPLLGHRSLNRRGLHVWRVAMAHRMAERRRRRLARCAGAADRAAFERDGMIVRPNFLPRRHFDRILAEAKSYHGAAREEIQGDTITRRIALSPSVLRSLPAIRDLLALPEFQGLVRYVGGFDAEPMFYLQTILTQAHRGPPDPQRTLHADAFHPTAKAWLFLTDVAADAAPFTYVPGSHKATPARLDWERRRSLDAPGSSDIRVRRGSFRIDPTELDTLGLPRPSVMAAPANTLLVADTFGFHARGPSDGPAFRVEIWAYLRHSPFLPWARLPHWNIPALARRRADIFWRWSDIAERAGLGRGVWRARPGRSAFDGPETPEGAFRP